VLEGDLVHLVARTAQGDQRSFKILYDQTAPRLHAAANIILRDKQLAEDVMQEAYVQVWHRAADYHSERGQVATWLLSILRYRAIDTLRKLKPTRGLGDADLNAVDEDTSAHPYSLALADEDAHRLGECLHSLAVSQRASITLAYFQGLTHQELAERLSTPIGTVKSRIRRGLTRLRECLEQ